MDNFNLSEDGKELIKYTGQDSLVEIPEGVEIIKTYAFYKCDCITSIKLPMSIKQIVNQAINKCANFSELIFPNDFNADCTGCSICSCPKLNSTIVFGNRLIRVPQSFEGKYIIPHNITEISAGAFCHCEKITEILMPTGLKKIEKYAINECRLLKQIIIPSTVEVIEEQAIIDCENLKHLIVDDKNKIYDSRDNSNAIIETATNSLLIGCNNTIIPNSITSIKDYAFSYCSNLLSIEIPNSVKSIGDSAFKNCSGLTEITIPYNVKNIDSAAFGNCNNLEKIIYQEGSVKLFYWAFYDCPNLKEIIIPDSVRPYFIFHNYKERDKKEPRFSIFIRKVFDKPIYNKDSFFGLPINFSGEYFVPEGIFYIDSYAFSGCAELVKIHLPKSIIAIGEYAFENCEALKSVIFEDGAHIHEIRRGTFKNCKSLKNITFPPNILQVSYEAFKDCIALESVKFEGWCILDIIESCAFSNCKSLKDINLPKYSKSISEYAFEGCDSLDIEKINDSRISRQESLGLTDDGEMLFTNGRLWPCPYCGNDGTTTYTDGTARCDSCHRWFRYASTRYF